AFNESFATFVQREGLRQWHRARHLPPPDPSKARRQREFTQLVLDTRNTLKSVYASALSDAEKRQRKQAAFAHLRQQYRRLRATRWHGHDDYKHWIDTPINNANLLPFGLYDQYVDAFAALFKKCDGDWATFYKRVAFIAAEDPAARKAFLHKGS